MGMNFKFPKGLAYEPRIRGIVVGKNHLGRTHWIHTKNFATVVLRDRSIKWRKGWRRASFSSERKQHC